MSLAYTYVYIFTFGVFFPIMLAWEMVDVQFSITTVLEVCITIHFFKKCIGITCIFFLSVFFNNKEEKMFEKGYILDA